MLIGYVSDENYVALADVAIEIDRDGELIEVIRSTPRGGVYAELEPGRYRFSLVKAGFGSKSVTLDLPLAEPYQFRLLSDCLLGYVWPKWVRTGERSEFRVHSHEPYQLTLWRYGLEKEFIAMLGWFDEHGPRAVMQITPDGDYVQTGVQWNKTGYGSAHHTQFVTGPERSGLYYLEAKTDTGKFFSFPWVVAPAEPANPIAVILSTNTWNAYNNFGGRSNYVNSTSLPPAPSVNARQDLLRYAAISTFGEWAAPDEDYQPVHFERPEPGNSIPGRNAGHRHDRRAARVRHGPGGMAPARLAGARGLRLRRLQRPPAPLRRARSDGVQGGRSPASIPNTGRASSTAASRNGCRREGGNFLYLGGNGLNCEVEFLDDGHGAQVLQLHADLGRRHGLHRP